MYNYSKNMSPESRLKIIDKKWNYFPEEIKRTDE